MSEIVIESVKVDGEEVIDLSKYTPEQRETYYNKLKEEAIQRRIENKNLKTQLADLDKLAKELDIFKKEKKEQQDAELIKRGEFDKVIVEKQAELTTLKSELEKRDKILKEYQEAEQKEVEDMKAKLPQNLKEKFVNINDKVAIQAVLELAEKGIASPQAGMTELEKLATGITNPEDLNNLTTAERIKAYNEYNKGLRK